MTQSPRIKNIAILSNYIPIQCGISTFAKNLFDSISRQKTSGEVVVVGVNDGQYIDDFPSEVVLEVSKNDKSDYLRAADYINSNGFDAVCIQHEYGIYGGVDGDYILDTMDRIKKPIIVTLHTVLESPSPDQRRIMLAMAQKAAKLVVMSEKAVQMLETVYGIPKAKIAMIHHGVPDAFTGTDPRESAQNGATFLTFGLLSPDKGIENVIQAMPRIVAQRPDAKYLVVGATHPHIKAAHGESYRESLEKMAEDLNVRDHVEFVNRFLSPCEIVDFMDQADIYVTPYLKREQITSGTLAYAIGSGKAVISTPYWYAEELLADDRGCIVPCRDPQAIADAAIEILTNDIRRKTIQNNALELGRTMSWRAVGREYIRLFESFEPQIEIKTNLLDTPTRRIPEFDLSHLRRMTDRAGLLQHAIYTVPRLTEGYCVDDNCRALLLTGMIQDSSQLPPADLDELSSKYLAFVAYAQNPSTKVFRNFLSYSGTWMEEEGSEDSQGRVLWCLAGFAVRSNNQSQIDCAMQLFEESFSVSRKWTSPRAWAYAILGAANLHRTRFYGPQLEESAARLASQLMAIRKDHFASDWQWFEPCLSYCNARMPQALIAAGRMLNDDELESVGLQSLNWLWNLQLDADGFFEPVGSYCPYFRNQEKPRFDQQPVEVYATLSACIEAWQTTGDTIWKKRAWQAFDWFLGANHLGLLVYDPQTGGCYDGVQERSLNQNQGAESTLSFLMACEEMRALTKTPPIPMENARMY